MSPARTSARIRIDFMGYLNRAPWRKRKKGGILRNPAATDHRSKASKQRSSMIGGDPKQQGIM
ncbi:hypothetical protein ALP26_101352 [Pseudomonas savastanoi pv. glycinea]|nr:hypothetical protein ALP26_101352 [Pseudomonas savastanoi pv. glycinea]